MEEIEKRKVLQQIAQEDLQRAKEEALRQKREVPTPRSPLLSILSTLLHSSLLLLPSPPLFSALLRSFPLFSALFHSSTLLLLFSTLFQSPLFSTLFHSPLFSTLHFSTLFRSFPLFSTHSSTFFYFHSSTLLHSSTLPLFFTLLHSPTHPFTVSSSPRSTAKGIDGTKSNKK
jgi:hypothetical protein